MNIKLNRFSGTSVPGHPRANCAKRIAIRAHFAGASITKVIWKLQQLRCEDCRLYLSAGTLTVSMSSARDLQVPQPSKTQDAKSQRAWPRYDVSIPVLATASLNGERIELHGQASDVSRGGLRLLLSREVSPGTSLLMHFILPYSSPRIAVRGIVRNRDGFSCGVEFVSPTTYQQQLIERACKAFELLR